MVARMDENFERVLARYTARMQEERRWRLERTRPAFSMPWRSPEALGASSNSAPATAIQPCSLRPPADKGIIAVDNMIKPAFTCDVERYRVEVRRHLELQTVLLPIGQGSELSCLWMR